MAKQMVFDDDARLHQRGRKAARAWVCVDLAHFLSVTSEGVQENTVVLFDGRAGLPIKRDRQVSARLDDGILGFNRD